MRELVQSFETGEIRLLEVGRPRVEAGRVLVRTVRSAVSPGTESSLAEMADKSLLAKALARPDQLRKVVDKALLEGPLEAYRQARARLGDPFPMGYSSAGVVVEVGPGVDDLVPGRRVACAGSGYARHAELSSVPRNLCVPIPRGVGFEEAAFVALGAVSLQAVRQARAELGHRVAVIGLGVLGQLTVRILKAAGCRVVAVDLIPEKVELARAGGADLALTAEANVAAAARDLTDGAGVDSVVIMASASGAGPLEQAAELCRERGRVVVTGLVGLEVPRKPFYEKEIELVVSRAWGPGMYDPDFEERGAKYPLPYVRWTADRNMSAFLELVAQGEVEVSPVVTHRIPFQRALDAYEMLKEGSEPYVGVVLEWSEANAPEAVLTAAAAQQATVRLREARRDDADRVGVGVLGAGLFARGTLLPALRKVDGVRLVGMATTTGTRSRVTAEGEGFEYATTDPERVLTDPDVDLVLILTRHGSHAELAARALEAGRHVFVEKPLAVTPEGLAAVERAYAAADPPPHLMVGFNRRFSPFTVWMKERFRDAGEPLAVHCSVNAGPVPLDHWVYQEDEGGGRILGELCHFVDLIRHLAGSDVVRVHVESLSADGYHPTDNVTASFRLADGGMGSIIYLSGGSKRHPRERVEVFGGGAVGIIDNFKRASFVRGSRRRKKRNWLEVDRGHVGELRALVRTLHEGGPPPVAFREYAHTTRVTFAMAESLRRGEPVDVA